MNGQHKETILVWLPSPLGDAILSTPTLRALRQRYPNRHILYMASKTVRAFLEPLEFCDGWLDYDGYWNAISQIRKQGIAQAILLKNSFGCAMAVFAGGAKRRIGYRRDGRGLFLTDKIDPPKDTQERFVPHSTRDYYLRIADHLDCSTQDTSLHLNVTDADRNQMQAQISLIRDGSRPVIVLVCGGAFGPSKLWPAGNFAQLADKLIEAYQAQIILSVAPTPQEKAISDAIRSKATHPLLSLADTPLRPGPLKALIEAADLVITNDTGPRHIAAALGRSIIGLYGPNNPEWTKTDYAKEKRIVGKAPCVPCDKPACTQSWHLCMESITVEQVFKEAQKILGEPTR